MIERRKPKMIEYPDGTKEWRLDLKLHRTYGPAVVYPEGTQMWYLNGKLHNPDGAAIKCANGTHYWYLHGEQLTEQEFLTKQAKEEVNK